jgi:molybdopterin converting factor small subunit
MALVRYWAGARAAAGCAQEESAASTVGDLLADISGRHDISRILRVSSLLVDGIAVTTDESARQLSDGAVVDVLPPFAGG